MPRHALAALVSPFVVAVALAGCFSPEPNQGRTCPDATPNVIGPVEEVRYLAVLVNSSGSLDGPIVLHIREDPKDEVRSEVWVRTGGRCGPGSMADLVVGAQVEAVADGPVTDTYPPQTVPSVVIVVR